MSAIDDACLEIFLAGLRIARRAKLEHAGFPRDAAEMLADIESKWRLQIASAGSPEDAMLAHIEWSESPKSWLDWNLRVQDPPPADALLFPVFPDSLSTENG